MSPTIVTFVVDTSSSMAGDLLEEAADGLESALFRMARNNQVGLVTFNAEVKPEVPVGTIVFNGGKIVDAVREARAQGESALYEAIKAGIHMTDVFPGEAEAIRGVVVLTDGRATTGDFLRLDELIMMTRDEKPIKEYAGFSDSIAIDEGGTPVAVDDKIKGTGLVLKTTYPIQIFFIGIGEDVDIEVGRMLAEATGAEFEVTTEEALANVIERFGKYF